jgi:FtsP/CotA-like multicopper oxidase with cupredoxin domain
VDRPGLAISITGSVPGPVIRMTEGKETLIRVHNHMSGSTSIHWHGILLPFNMDGVPGINFPGISPGETFTCRFLAGETADIAESAGADINQLYFIAGCRFAF